LVASVATFFVLVKVGVSFYGVADEII